MRFRSKARKIKVNDRRTCNPLRRALGFTLIEMVVVMFVMMIILAIAVPNYIRSVQRAHETTLHQNLAVLNKAIQEYSLDKKQAPQSLQDLVPGYIKFVPNDITGKPDTWKTDPEDSEDAWDPNQIGIKSVHSGSDDISSTGEPYSSWTH